VNPAGPTESGTLLKSEALMSDPYRDARTITTLPSGERVQVLARQGGWLEVRAATGRGWVHMLSVRRGEAAKGTGAGDVAGLLGLASGRAGTGRVVATTGIRGLTEEQLKEARFDAAELGRSDALVLTAADAKAFAAAGKLTSRPVEYLPAPAN
jgi:hypothetical protein